jgi:exonuclease VII small subunit
MVYSYEDWRNLFTKATQKLTKTNIDVQKTIQILDKARKAVEKIHSQIKKNKKPKLTKDEKFAINYSYYVLKDPISLAKRLSRSPKNFKGKEQLKEKLQERRAILNLKRTIDLFKKAEEFAKKSQTGKANNYNNQPPDNFNPQEKQ